MKRRCRREKTIVKGHDSEISGRIIRYHPLTESIYTITMLAGFIIGGRMLPNANVGRAIPMGMEPGVLHGYVSESGGLPTIGATVMAVQQRDDFYASTFVSVNGQYYMNLQPGE
ncbi:MAG TPA: hypothetical protein VIP53_05105 [Nitrososphaera sp.]